MILVLFIKMAYILSCASFVFLNIDFSGVMSHVAKLHLQTILHSIYTEFLMWLIRIPTHGERS